ncbi:hypothetical protein HPB49_018772 [Dermacentor silvarum]|uniref:Uncharacterized protein n=1 Tax=Dermacentor silvarum TaxID=543639 RepID=A0ACB8E2A1_DERSI|nr:hypothetical protein HPB49_018772 [Dermacentor silvarum]
MDPKGRALMVAAVEKQKLVYILNRDAAARLTISSPLEAHKSSTLVYHCVGVDVGFENPVFACLEMDYEEADSDPTGEAANNTHQTLTFYELDLGLNHVVRKYSEPLEEHGNFLIAVPGGSDGPSGVLICSENYITYKNFGDQPDIRCPIPRRRNDLDDPERGMIFVCSANHKTKVTEIKLKYFDTIPVAASMCVLKTGFLFVAAEFGNHCLYQIARLGEEDEEPEFSSAIPLEEGDTFFFAPRALRNLLPVEELDSLSPAMGCTIADLANEDTPQLYVACGRGPRSCVRVLRHGLEVYPEGIRHIRADKRVNEWRTPGKKAIVKCAVNQRQVVIALTGGELVYFEMDPTGQLNEYTDRREMSADIICMSLASVPTGEQRSRFLAVGLADNTVRIISLDPSDCLSPLSMQALPATPESLSIVEMGMTEVDASGQGILYLNIGLQNGVLLRTVLDQVTGDLSDTRTRYLGSRPVKLFKVRMQGSDAALAMSSRSWLSYYYQNRFHLTPLSYETLEFASGFSSEQCPEGIVAISTNTLRILALEKLGAVFNQVSTALEYTPRKFVVNSDSGHLIIVETDHNAYTEKMKQQRKQQMAEVALEQNEAALSVALVKFASQPDEQYVVVGAARELSLQPWHARSGGLLLTYRLSHAGETRLELVHATSVEEAPTALCPFQGRLLAGVGKCLRLYDLGRKKLLRKCENKYIPSAIVTIQSMGNRVVVGDVQESFFFLRYKRQENQLVIFADDAVPRWITASCMLDYDTVAGADKFGNVSIIRLPNSISDEVDEDPTGIKSLWDRGWLGGSSQKDHDFFQHLEMHMRSENPPLCGRDHLSFRSSYFPVKVSKKLEDIRTRYAF